MKKQLAQALLSLVLASLISILTTLLLNRYTYVSTQLWPGMLIYFFALGFALKIVYVTRAGKENFAGLLIAAIVIKLLLAMIALLIYSFIIEREALFSFAIHFIAYYILFTIFEIRYLLQLIKKHPVK